MSVWGGILNRFRRWHPPVGNDRAADDWRTGDLAVCITGGSWTHLWSGMRVDGPKEGELLRVVAVGFGMGHHALTFHGGGSWWTAVCFRKVRPNNREACDPRFAQLIRKHSREGVDA